MFSNRCQQNRVQQLLLGGKVVIEACLRDSQLVRDLVEGGGVERFAPEHLGRLFDDEIAPLVESVPFVPLPGYG